MKPGEHPLALSAHRLAVAAARETAGREGHWADLVGQILQQIAEALTWDAAVATPHGLLEPVDWTRPSLARRADRLRRDDARLRTEAAGLRDAIGNALSGPELDALRDRVRRFAEEVEQHCRTETGLVLESVTTDIGAGD